MKCNEDDLPQLDLLCRRSEPLGEMLLKRAWKVLIVDDERLIHATIQRGLEHCQFDGDGLQILHAYSTAEARILLQHHPDTALVLIDIFLETPTAGLDLVKYIRNSLNNRLIRLVLMTGQTDAAPALDIIETYDINDYKEKLELTTTKLKTLAYSMLRAYRDIVALDKARSSLELVVAASAQIVEIRSLQKFTSAVLMQLTALLNLGTDAAYIEIISGFAAANRNGRFQVLAGSGAYSDLVDGSPPELSDPDIIRDLDSACQQKRNLYFDNRLVAYFNTGRGFESLLYMNNLRPLNDQDKYLINLFCSNIAIAFENAYLREEIAQTQKEIVYLLSEAVETRSRETGNHVKRVAEISKLLALELNFSPEEAEHIKLAAPLHDLGKIGIPDAILHKPGALTREERETMKTHVTIGHDMLKRSQRPVLQYGAIIALEHHEHWNGDGYPAGKSGEEIHILGRIVAVADVFDSLANQRCYKKAWSLRAILEHFREKRGQQFDPQIVDTLLANIDAVLDIMELYKDEGSNNHLRTQWYQLQAQESF